MPVGEREATACRRKSGGVALVRSIVQRDIGKIVEPLNQKFNTSPKGDMSGVSGGSS